GNKINAFNLDFRKWIRPGAAEDTDQSALVPAGGILSGPGHDRMSRQFAAKIPPIDNVLSVNDGDFDPLSIGIPDPIGADLSAGFDEIPARRMQEMEARRFELCFDAGALLRIFQTDFSAAQLDNSPNVEF